MVELRLAHQIFRQAIPTWWAMPISMVWSMYLISMSGMATNSRLTAQWTKGDFNADGVTDVPDFNLWNSNKFTSADAANAVPEPGAVVLTCLAFAMLGVMARKGDQA